MGSRFVRPDVCTLPISRGESLTVKRQLTAGEQRGRFARMSTQVGDGSLSLNRLQVGLSTITAYLVDWTLTDDDGRRVEIKGLDTAALERVLDALDPDSFGELLQAIETHEAAMVEEKKSSPTTGLALSVT